MPYLNTQSAQAKKRQYQRSEEDDTVVAGTSGSGDMTDTADKFEMLKQHREKRAKKEKE